MKSKYFWDTWNVPPISTRSNVPNEDIPITTPLSPTPIEDEDVAANKSNEITIGPITKARAKLSEQVNSLLIEPDVLFNENFILPKSMHLYMIKFVDNTSIARGGEELQQKEEDLTIKCAREAGAPASCEDQIHMREYMMTHQDNLRHDVYTSKARHI
jgi:hypothetical protein